MGSMIGLGLSMSVSRDRWRHKKGRKSILISDRSHACVKQWSEEYEIPMSNLLNKIIEVIDRNKGVIDAILDLRTRSQTFYLRLRSF